MNKIWAIAKNYKNKSGRGTEVARATMWSMILFGLVVICSIVATYFWFWQTYYSHLWDDGEPTKVVVVNAPDEFIESIGHIPNEYKHSFYQHSYVYDIAYFNKLMQKNDASLAIVFPPVIEGGEVIDILTYYPFDSLEYMEIRDDYSDTILSNFDTYLIKIKGVPVSDNANVHTYSEASFAPNGPRGKDLALQDAALSLIPLVLFILILYIAMSSGTTTISGAKEQNSFAAILLTPTPVSSIVLGTVLHVWLKTMMPVAIISVLLVLVPTYRQGVIILFILMSIMALFVSAITVLLSALNDTVVAAQTAFLPIFLIFIVLCVTCMQNPENYGSLYYAMPLYGQFLGSGNALIGNHHLLMNFLSTLITFALSVICIVVTIALLKKERFTVAIISSSEKSIRRNAKLMARQEARTIKLQTAKDSVFGYTKVSQLNHFKFNSTQILRPLGLLAVFQTLALVPPLLLTDGKGLTDILLSLKNVSNYSDILSSSAAIVAVFMSTPAFLISMAVGYWLIIAMYYIRIRFIEKDSMSTIGLPNGKIILKYLLGLVLGFVLIGSVYLILLLTNQITSEFHPLDSEGIILFIAYIMMWIPQGATEEIMFRGYMLSRISTRYGRLVAIGVSSLLFCLFHGLNPGFTVLALINLVLISILYALIAIRTNHIWSLLAAHTMWNFAQGNLFGLEVSGNVNNAALMVSHATKNSSALMTGGSFGPEGGLAVTIVACIGIAVLLIMNKRHPNTSK